MRMKRIRTKIEFSGVPIGTKGTAEFVKDIDEDIGINRWRITWELEGVRASPNRPLVEWIHQKEFDDFLEEI